MLWVNLAFWICDSIKPDSIYLHKPIKDFLSECYGTCLHAICWLSTSGLIGNLSADIIRHVHPRSSCCCFGLARATRCQACCNIKQHALTLNGRTPAAKATTKRLPLTAFPLFSASYMTPAPSWKKIAATLPWTGRRTLERPLQSAQAGRYWGWSDGGEHSAPACKSWWSFPFRRSTWRVI